MSDQTEAETNAYAMGNYPVSDDAWGNAQPEVSSPIGSVARDE